MTRGVSASGKIWPQCPVLLCCNKSSRGEPRCLLWVVSCWVQTQPGLWCGQLLWLSGISFWFFPDLVVDLLAFLVIAHLLCLRRACLGLIGSSQWQHKILVLLSFVARLPLKRQAVLVLRSWESLYCPVVFPLVLRQFLKYFFGVTDLELLLPPYQYFIFFPADDQS